MKWLVGFHSTVSTQEMGSVLADLKCTTPDGLYPIEMGEGEVVVEVDGPRDLPAGAGDRPELTKVYPSSDPQPYGPS